MNKILLCMAALAAAFIAVPARDDARRTDPLAPKVWECSQWISVKNAPVVTGEVKRRENCRAADGANWFEARIANPRKVASARWMATSLGVFELYVNGTRVGKEVLRPGFTHREKTKYSFTYDVTSLLKTGKGAGNVFSAQVTPGWWADKIITPDQHEGMFGRKCAFRSVLELTFTDGSRQLIGTDTERWKAGIAGPVRHAAIFDGEEYDARVLPGWKTPELLEQPEVNAEFSGEILPSPGAEVYHREDLALKPVRAWVWEGVENASKNAYGKVSVKREYSGAQTVVLQPGETLVVDFGQNAAAVPEFLFSAKEGTVLTCLPGELLNDGNGARSRGMDGPEGSVHRLNLRAATEQFRLVYTFGPRKGYVSYRPFCTFFGYRYISVTATGTVSIKNMASIPVTSIAENLETGTLRTGDESINKLISNTLWGQRSNYLSVPTDCPQRNERLGWTADTQVFTETGSFFADTDAFFHKWMKDMRDSQSETGSFPAVAPTAQYGDNMMRHGWSDAGVIVPWTVWKQFGDTAIIDENWDAMVRYMNHVDETRFDYDAIADECGRYQYGDWLSYEPLESHGGGAVKTKDGVRYPYPEAVEYWNFISACYWAMDAGKMRDMAAATGRDAGKYASMQASAKAYIREKFLKPDGSFKLEILNGMQTPALFALTAGVLDEAGSRVAGERLRTNFAAHGCCLQTGFLGTSILMDALTENGMADIAWDLLFQRKNPSWLYSVDNGATTIWERWNSYTKEKGMGPRGMNSFNHYAYGCVCAWIWKTAAGIAADTSAPGFRHIIMKPVPDKRLGRIDASYRSAAGLIESSWRFDGDLWIWDFTVPEGSSASVTVPWTLEERNYGPGKHEIRVRAENTATNADYSATQNGR
ncbi:MAG: family 78 glycoside hydrolase catalytic domain [Bacteroidales bacterium]|nr:family 78 glycoside hydrolase catalytic domain [Bacteroidales bacterium]